MKQVAILMLLGILGVPPGFGQAAAPDSTTLQSILTELRAIHTDVRLSQTTQILLAELEVQESAVSRALQRVDDKRLKLSQIQGQEKSITDDLALLADNSSTLDVAQKKELTDQQESMKARVITLRAQEQDGSNSLLDAQSQLSKEQNTLDRIQDQLDAVVKKLQPTASQ